MAIQIEGKTIISYVDQRLHLYSIVEINEKFFLIKELIEFGKKSQNQITQDLVETLEQDLNSDIGLLIGYPVALLYLLLIDEGLISV